MLATAERIRVLCVDDNAVVRESLGLVARGSPGLEVVGFLTSAEGLEEAVARLHPDIVVLDLDMPGPEAVEVMARLSRDHPESRAIIYSGQVTTELVDRAFDAGAWGYVSKSEEVGAIVEAIGSVAHGHVALRLGVPIGGRMGPDAAAPNGLKGTHAGPATAPCARNGATKASSGEPVDRVEEASRESFPASDPPGYLFRAGGLR